MLNKFIKIYICLMVLSLLIGIYGCGKKKAGRVITPTRMPPVSKKVILPKRTEIRVPKYVYKGERYKDPFVSLEANVRLGSSISERAPLDINIETLRLTGIISEPGKKRSAILSDSRGSGGFIVKNGRLLNIDGKMIPGVAGVVKKDKVVIITDNNVIKELKLREK